LKKLAQDKAASAFFKTLNKTNLYSIAYRLQTAKKPQTGEKRIQAIIGKLSRREKFHRGNQYQAAPRRLPEAIVSS
jgi:uncharacterized protein YdeI (YjbR/CyaY-like superfamily)